MIYCQFMMSNINKSCLRLLGYYKNKSKIMMKTIILNKYQIK